MKPVFIIAEAGVNHNGSVALAEKLIDVAVASGADAVKFQTFIPEKEISIYAPKAEYQKKTTHTNESQLEMAKKLQLSSDEHIQLATYCKQKNILFLSTPFDLDSIAFLHSLGLQIFKIPSGEITNLPYLRAVGKLQKKVIMSTGMAYLEEVCAALDVLLNEGTKKDDVTLLHCTTEYPTPIQDVNLHAMLTLQKTCGVPVGYSDHTLGIEVPIAAVALGATVIEKHFTLDKNMEGPDHKASLEPHELKNMVRAIRTIEKALGDGIKRPSPSEEKNIAIARKSIVAAKNIKKGETFTEQNITTKRPGTGINPMKWDAILGCTAMRDFQADELITTR